MAAVALGGGKENSRIFGQVARYGSPDARRAVPLATALSSLSNPECSLVDLLNKYSHDDDPEVVHNATLALGLVGAGTNNARLAAMLRQLATYHATEPANLFLVRISQGLVHLGKVRWGNTALLFYSLQCHKRVFVLFTKFFFFHSTGNFIVMSSALWLESPGLHGSGSYHGRSRCVSRLQEFNTW